MFENNLANGQENLNQNLYTVCNSQKKPQPQNFIHPKTIFNCQQIGKLNDVSQSVNQNNFKQPKSALYSKDSFRDEHKYFSQKPNHIHQEIIHQQLNQSKLNNSKNQQNCNKENLKEFNGNENQKEIQSSQQFKDQKPNLDYLNDRKYILSQTSEGLYISSGYFKRKYFNGDLVNHGTLQKMQAATFQENLENIDPNVEIPPSLANFVQNHAPEGQNRKQNLNNKAQLIKMDLQTQKINDELNQYYFQNRENDQKNYKKKNSSFKQKKRDFQMNQEINLKGLKQLISKKSDSKWKNQDKRRQELIQEDSEYERLPAKYVKYNITGGSNDVLNDKIKRFESKLDTKQIKEINSKPQVQQQKYCTDEYDFEKFISNLQNKHKAINQYQDEYNYSNSHLQNQNQEFNEHFQEQNYFQQNFDQSNEYQQYEENYNNNNNNNNQQQNMPIFKDCEQEACDQLYHNLNYMKQKYANNEHHQENKNFSKKKEIQRKVSFDPQVYIEDQNQSSLGNYQDQAKSNQYQNNQSYLKIKENKINHQKQNQEQSKKVEKKQSSSEKKRNFEMYIDPSNLGPNFTQNIQLMSKTNPEFVNNLKAHLSQRVEDQNQKKNDPRLKVKDSINQKAV